MSQINAIINKLRGIQNNSLGVITLANDLDIDSVTEIFKKTVLESRMCEKESARRIS